MVSLALPSSSSACSTYCFMAPKNTTTNLVAKVPHGVSRAKIFGGETEKSPNRGSSVQEGVDPLLRSMQKTEA